MEILKYSTITSKLYLSTVFENMYVVTGVVCKRVQQ